MFKHIITALLTVTLGVSLFGAQEPVVNVKAAKAAAVKAECKKAAKDCKACPKAAKDCKACPKAAKDCKVCPKAAKACGKAVLPACAKKDAANSDPMVSWYKDSKGYFYLVYDWEKSATVYARSFNKGAKVFPGGELMTVAPQGRSKGKIKNYAAVKVVEVGKNTDPADILKKGDLIAKFAPIAMAHDSVSNAEPVMVTLPGWGDGFKALWESTGLFSLIQQTCSDFKVTWTLGLGRVIMILVSLVLLYLAIVKGFEPLLLLPIGFGALLANIPVAGISNPGGLQWMIYQVGIESGVFPLLIFMSVGAMTDFGPLIANPKTALLGGAAQLGIFSALLGAVVLSWLIPGIDFSLKDAGSIGIIGGADGPTSIFVTARLSPHLLGAIAVAAYSYMALVPVIQPPIMKLLTTEAERKIKMKQLRTVGKVEKICFPVLITLLCALLLPDAAPLIGMLMFGNLMKESGVVSRLSDTAANALCNIVTIFLGIAVGSKLSADQFLSLQTIGILILGCVAFAFATAGGVIFAKIMNLFSKEKINPLIGSAGVSAVPMAARVANKVGLESDPGNFLLMHAMGPNVAGVIGSAVAAGVLLCMLNK